MSSLSPFLGFRQLHVLDLHAFCLYSQAADVSRVCFSSFFLVRKIVNLLFYFSQFDICKIVYSFQLAKNLFLEGCRVERREATSMSFSKRGHGW